MAIFDLLDKWKGRAKEWVMEKVESAYVKWWLAGIAFAEAAFFVLPVEPFLIAFLIAKPRGWLFYSLWTAMASVLGGIAGYFIGWGAFDVLGRPLIEFYSLESEMEVARQMFADNAFWAVFVSAFTPIPYKVFTIGAGFFGINWFVFLGASVLGRVIRFLIIGYVLKLYGWLAGRLIYRYFNYLTLVAGLVVVFLFLYFYLY